MDNEQLVQIDQAINQELKKLTLLAESMTLTEVALFELSYLTDVIAEEAHHYPGIYLFEIRADLSSQSFRVKTLQLYVENYDVIATHLESFFRENCIL